MILLELFLLFILVVFVMRLIGFYVWSHDTLKRFKQIRAEKRAGRNRYQEPTRRNNVYPIERIERKEETDDWYYDPKTKSFKKK